MRWFWIDSFVEFDSGRRAVAVKNVSLAEEYMHDHFPGFPVMPAALVIEGMAQTAGILVGEAGGFKENVILAKVRRAVFHGHARPGDRLSYETVLESLDDRGGVTAGLVKRGSDVLAEIDLMFSHVRPGDRNASVPEENFVFTGDFLRLLANVRGTATEPMEPAIADEAEARA
ncbi:MAG: beta-hydroxyacyl-ACP dehydratase [Phycisphaerae bacterium]|nr:beta-hydroxyacyl-ACP dehydratase [Phycisphaerae bacterium]